VTKKPARRNVKRNRCLRVGLLNQSETSREKKKKQQLGRRRKREKRSRKKTTFTGSDPLGVAKKKSDRPVPKKGACQRKRKKGVSEGEAVFGQKPCRVSGVWHSQGSHVRDQQRFTPVHYGAPTQGGENRDGDQKNSPTVVRGKKKKVTTTWGKTVAERSWDCLTRRKEKTARHGGKKQVPPTGGSVRFKKSFNKEGGRNDNLKA